MQISVFFLISPKIETPTKNKLTWITVVMYLFLDVNWNNWKKTRILRENLTLNVVVDQIKANCLNHSIHTFLITFIHKNCDKKNISSVSGTEIRIPGSNPIKLKFVFV